MSRTVVFRTHTGLFACCPCSGAAEPIEFTRRRNAWKSFGASGPTCFGVHTAVGVMAKRSGGQQPSCRSDTVQCDRLQPCGRFFPFCGCRRGTDIDSLRNLRAHDLRKPKLRRCPKRNLVDGKGSSSAGLAARRRWPGPSRRACLSVTSTFPAQSGRPLQAMLPRLRHGWGKHGGEKWHGRSLRHVEGGAFSLQRGDAMQDQSAAW